MITLFLQVLLSLAPRTDIYYSSAATEKLSVVDFDGLEKYLEQFGDRTIVLNFWASWCVPCVKELPYFEKATRTYPQEDVAIVLVSLDFTKKIDTVLKPFLKAHDVQSEVIVLDDPDQTTWINKVDPSWSGAIPVTLIRKGDKRVFYEKAFQSYEELSTAIQSL